MATGDGGSLMSDPSSIAGTLFYHPIGAFLTEFDGLIQNGMNQALTGMGAYVNQPLIICCALFCIWHGVKVANADGVPVHKLVPTFLKISAIIWLSTNLTEFDYYVRDFFYSDLPQRLGMAVLGKSPSSTQEVGSAFDAVWNQAMNFSADVYQESSWTDIGARASAELCVIGISIALVAMAFVFIMARFLLAIVIAFGPVMIGCLLFDSTKPIFERWVGKLVALVALQIGVVLSLEMLLVGNQTLMRNISSSTGVLSVPVELGNLIIMLVWFGFSALAMYALPAVAYSIGSGVQVNALSQAAGAALGLKYLTSGGGPRDSQGKGSNQLPGGGMSLAPNTTPRPEPDIAGLLAGPPAEPPLPLHEGARGN